MNPEKARDRQFEDYLVTRVLPTAKGWILSLDSGWSVAIPRGPVEPKPGSMARVYGLGLGFRVRGVDLDGQEMYYRTPAEEDQRHRRAMDAYHEGRR